MSYFKDPALITPSNLFQNILRIFVVLPYSSFTTSEKIYDYHLKTWHIQDALPAAEQLKTFKD